MVIYPRGPAKFIPGDGDTEKLRSPGIPGDSIPGDQTLAETESD